MHALKFQRGKEKMDTLMLSTKAMLRPSKCPKLYTNRILGKMTLRQKVREFCQNSN